MRQYFLKHYFSILVGFVLTGSVLWLQFSEQETVRSIVNRLDFIAYDTLLNATLPAAGAVRSTVVIIDIDEASLREEGRWPWSRQKVAKLTAAAKNHGAKTIGFDVSFAEQERNIATELIQAIEADFPSQRGKTSFLQELETKVDRDLQFADQLRKQEVVLGTLFHAEELSSIGELPPPWMTLRSPQKEQLLVPKMGGYNSNLSVLQQAATDGGFLNTTPDDDGIIRRTPLVLKHGDNIYPSLSFAMAKIHNQALRFKIETANNNGVESVLGLWLNRYFIPTDSYGRALVPYIGKRQSFTYISATELLNADSSNQGFSQFPELQGAAVLVGTSALGLFDLRNTPMEPAFPGVEIQASLLQAMIDQTLFPSEPEWSDAVAALLIIIFGLSLSIIAPALSPRSLFVLAAVIIIPLVAIQLWLWSSFKLSFTPVMPAVIILSVIGLNAIRGFFNESSLRGEIHGMFGQYVPAAHIDKMINSPGSASFSGETKNMSVLFCDIRNFTTISESLDATQLKGMLNAFFTPLTEIIFESQGTIDKYIGDLVMAFWGAPLDDPDHRKHSVEGALEMLAKVDELRPLFVAQGLPEIHVGIGINSGDMNVGDMGSSFRRAYTVLGDAVNLSARLEGLTKYYGVSLLVGEQTWVDLDGFLFRYIDRVKVKGKEQPIDIYQPLCRTADITEQQLTLAKIHDQAMTAYMEQRWDDAISYFKQVLSHELECVQAKLFLERIETLSAEPPEADWDGSYRHTQK
jgi:adenylate cyclase